MESSKLNTATINGTAYAITAQKHRLGSVSYKGKELDICFSIEGYYIQYGKKRISIEV